MQVVILAAGKGSRMGDLTSKIHKSLLPINAQDSFLSHLLHQLNECQLTKVIIITGYLSESIVKVTEKFQMNIEILFNERYLEDTNIYSMKLALDKVIANEPTIIFEADTFIDSNAFRKIIDEAGKDESIWFTKGRFGENQYGGILKSDNESNITDIKIVPSYETKYLGYEKLLGIQSIGSSEIGIYKRFLNLFVEKGLNQYYLAPWIENLKSLPCKSFDLNTDVVESVNSEEEYKSLVQKFERNRPDRNIELIPVKSLKPIEGHIKKRAAILSKEILSSGYWTKPIVVEEDNFLILDGHHRFSVAQKLCLKNIPVVFTKYDEVELWSLREDEIVDRKKVINRAVNKDLYPNKTVKHLFPFTIPECKISLSKLK